MQHDDEIDQGATFYRIVTLYTDGARTVTLPKVPGFSRPIRSTLMDQQGVKVADFACSWINEEIAQLAWSMPAGTTGPLDPAKKCIHSLDTDEQDGTVVRRLRGNITVIRGQKKP